MQWTVNHVCMKEKCMATGASTGAKGPCVNISTFLPSESSLDSAELKQTENKFSK